MSISQGVGAPLPLPVQWQSINWQRAEREVQRLQMRIAKACNEGKWNKVKCLQRILTHSFAAKVIAVKRVSTNKGSRTAGIDGEVWRSPTAKMNAVKSLTLRGYKCRPLRRVLIPKANGKMRKLGIPTMYDRAVQALFKLALEPISETLADKNSYGFRPYRACKDAISQCFVVFSRKNSARWVLEAE